MKIVVRSSCRACWHLAWRRLYVLMLLRAALTPHLAKEASRKSTSAFPWLPPYNQMARY